MIPRYRPHIGYKHALAAIFSGPGDAGEVERAVCRTYGYSQAVWFPAARVAAQAFLESVAPQGRVVYSPYNCVALQGAVSRAGWESFFVDVAVGEYNPHPDAIADALSQPENHAAFLVSLWGIPAETAGTLDAVLSVAKPVLHDYALRSLDLKPPAVLRPGDAVLYSFNWSKPLTGFGGAVLCGQDAMFARHWRSWRDSRFGVNLSFLRRFDPLLVKVATSPAFFRMASTLSDGALASGVAGRLRGTELVFGSVRPVSRWQVSLVAQELKNVSSLRQLRWEQVQVYAQYLREGLDGCFQLPPLVPTLSHFPLLIRGGPSVREALKRRLRRDSIFSSDSLFGALVCAHAASYPNALKLTQEVLHLPLYRGLPHETQQRISKSVVDFFLRAKSKS